MKELNLYNLLERLNNLLRTEVRKNGAELGLQPVQIQALYYLSVCNKYSDTPAAVKEYLGLTKGTTSQSLMVLDKKNLVIKSIDEKDKRVIHLELTATGKQVLKDILPPSFIKHTLAKMKKEDYLSLADSLQNFLLMTQKANDNRSFGVCKTCRFNLKENNSYKCGLTGELLQKKEIEKICFEHEYKNTH